MDFSTAPRNSRGPDVWLRELMEEADARPSPLHPAVQELETFISGSAELSWRFREMFTQAPLPLTGGEDPTGGVALRDCAQMLRVFSLLMTRAPEFDTSALVGVPFAVLLNRQIRTSVGRAAFLDSELNRHLKRLLNEWGRFLRTPASRYVLTDEPRRGWFGEDALKKMPGFTEEFRCDPTRPYHGFDSWDAFFTREFRPGRRPVAAPDDDAVLVNPCEAAPYRLAHGVRDRDRFWIKSQPYSLQHMLGLEGQTTGFDGGTVYQAFLGATNYHRWHSPVSGRVVKTRILEGLYFTEAPEGEDDPATPTRSQSYLTAVSTRALVLLEADNPNIGRMGFLAVGMTEVSTCEVLVREGQHVRKGEPLGMFHFGGSTCCLVFGPWARLDFDFQDQSPGPETTPLRLNSRLATVR